MYSKKYLFAIVFTVLSWGLSPFLDYIIALNPSVVNMQNTQISSVYFVIIALDISVIMLYNII